MLYESLGSSEKARYMYIAEPGAVAFPLEDDPNSKESGRIFETNMTSWPPCIISNSSYPGGKLCLLKASVNLSQRTPPEKVTKPA